ncbi:hypothetical protein V8E51_013384 [Hyaloscypha variabilis]
MRLTHLLIFLVLFTLTTAPKPEDSGAWRNYDVRDTTENHNPRFAEYDASGCRDWLGKHKPDFMDFSPVHEKCYDLKKDTVSFYHERGFMSQLKLYPEYGCGGEVYIDRSYQSCQDVQRRWEPYYVRSFRMR